MHYFSCVFCFYIFFRLLASAKSQCARVLEENTCHFLIGTNQSNSAVADCTIVNCNTNGLLNMIDKARGKVTFALPTLPPACNVTRYEIALRVRQIEADCHTADIEWKTHSRRNVHIAYCSDKDITCRNSSPPCQEKHFVSFGYIYTSWYQLKVTPHLGSSTRQAQRSMPFNFITSYKPKGLVDLNSTVSSLQYRDDNSESRVSFLFSPDLDWGEADRFHVTLRLVSRVDSELQEAACYASGNEHSCCAFRAGKGNQTIVDCSTDNAGIEPNCSATRTSVHCQFRNMTPGPYCAILLFLDDRCEPDTVWTEPDNRPCQWQTYKEFLAEPQKKLEHSAIVESYYGIIYAIVGAVLGALLVLISFFLVQRYRSKRRQRLPSQPAETVHHRFTVENRGRHFSFSNQFTLTDRPRPEVLLIYCRESKPFIDLCQALRTVLVKICKCQVYDYFDEGLWDSVSVDPEGWVRELIMEREAKVVIVASRAAASSNKPDAVTYRNPHAFDHLFPFALKLLRDFSNDSSYRTHFVVVFDGYTDNNHLVDHLNPFTRFILPKHLNKLFEHLHDSNTTVHFDTSRKLEEREEVRQLRLRLEHLINLNLLSKSEQVQIYDW